MRRIGIMEAISEEVAPETPSALDDLVQTENQADETGDYDALHQKTQELIQDHLDNADNDESTEVDMSSTMGEADQSLDAESSNSEADADSQPDADAAATDSSGSADKPKSDAAASTDSKPTEDAPSDDEKPVEQEVKDNKKQSPVTEALREGGYDHRLVVESIGGTMAEAGSAFVQGLGAVTAFTASMLGRLAGALKDLGVEYSPRMLAGMRKTVIYLYTKSVTTFLKSIIAAETYIKRNRYSFSKLKNEISKLRESIDAMEHRIGQAGGGELVFRTKFTEDSELQRWFAAGGAINPMRSATIVKKFLGDAILQLDRQIVSDLAGIQKLIELSEHKLSGDPLHFMQIPPFTGNFLKKQVAGYTGDTELIESYVYGVTLPDRILFMANLPRPGLRDLDSVAAAYHDSGVFLGVDKAQMPGEIKIDYMNLMEIRQFLEVLEGICDQALSHASLYERINKQNASLKFSYKSYYQKLVASAKEATIRDTLVEFVYLKQSFVTRTYLPAAMDVHDYVSAYLVRALRFAKDNVAQWTVGEDSSAD